MKEEAETPGAPRGREPRSVSVIIPCHDEASTVADVVAAFRRTLPDANVVVVDNASTDGTAARAAQAGARVVFEPRLGKGFAVLSGLRAESSADLVILVDGDGTYPAESAPALIAMAAAGADMVVGARVPAPGSQPFRRGHTLGNRLFVMLVRLLFGIRTRDLFSGYRVLTRRFLETAPLIATKFEVEAELSLQARVQELPVAEIEVPFHPRQRGTASKLRTFSDGSHILIAILTFFRDYRPVAFFGTLSLLLLAAALGSAACAVATSGEALVAVIASSTFVVLAMVSLACGVVLSSINRRSAEMAARLLLR